jgi:hypothetical protein
MQSGENTLEILDKVKKCKQKSFIELETGKEVEHLDQKMDKNRNRDIFVSLNLNIGIL